MLLSGPTNQIARWRPSKRFSNGCLQANAHRKHIHTHKQTQKLQLARFAIQKAYRSFNLFIRPIDKWFGKSPQAANKQSQMGNGNGKMSPIRKQKKPAKISGLAVTQQMCKLVQFQSAPSHIGPISSFHLAHYKCQWPCKSTTTTTCKQTDHQTTNTS